MAGSTLTHPRPSSSHTSSPKFMFTFFPSPILDISTLRYCSYCFTCTREPTHGLSTECSLSQIPLYWPESWPECKCLSWAVAKCVMCDVHAETPQELVTHVTDQHSEFRICKRAKVEDEVKAEVTSAVVKTEPDPPQVKSESANSSMYKCRYCNRGTPHLDVITQHFARVHQTYRTYVCEECKMITKHASSMNKHKLKRHSSGQPPPNFRIIDTECCEEGVYDGDDTLMTPLTRSKTPSESPSTVSTEHVSSGKSKTETSVTESAVPSSGFSKGRKQEETLENYNNFVVDETSKNYKIHCALCEYTAVSKGSVVRHMELKHYSAISETLVNMTDNTTTYRCITCATTTDSKHKLAVHFTKVHMDITPLRCTICLMEFEDITYLKGHIKSDRHGDQYRRALRCDECLYASLTKKDMVTHKYLAHTPDFPCNKCDTVTKSESLLKRHMRDVHTLTKGSDKLFRCDQCEYVTRVKSDIVHHMAVHSAHTTHPCPKCDFVAVNASGLFTHNRKIHRDKHSEILG